MARVVCYLCNMNKMIICDFDKVNLLEYANFHLKNSHPENLSDRLKIKKYNGGDLFKVCIGTKVIMDFIRVDDE